jgi:glutamate/tyrosine decarboxylase-like PLP-dependent enzyme
VTPDVEPGYLREILPREAPFHGENWNDIFKDFETKIMPGITHWQHPKFHAYFPAGNSYPSIMGDMLSSGLGIVGFSWAASPSCTELETIVLDWLGRMINLPKLFLPFADEKEVIPNGNSIHSAASSRDYSEDEDILAESLGGGVILGSASECILVSLLSARTNMLGLLKAKHPFVEDGILLSKLVMYTSKLVNFF